MKKRPQGTENHSLVNKTTEAREGGSVMMLQYQLSCSLHRPASGNWETSENWRKYGNKRLRKPQSLVCAVLGRQA